MSDSGRRCAAKCFLEFDHRTPVADGGPSTSENVRLLCRAHNQLEAERRFGKGFMERKRQEARGTAAPARTPRAAMEPTATTEPSEHAPGHTAIQAQRAEIVPYLRQLGFKADQARQGAGLCDHLLGQPLGVLVKHALQQLGRARFERCTQRPSAA